MQNINFQPDPRSYCHWRLQCDGAVAQLFMDVDEKGGLFGDYLLKLNSYDLGVDIELADIVLRLRFEHPEVKAVILRSGKERVFCAGANIRMLAEASHGHKVNFCKFTNETRNTIESAGDEAGQTFIAAITGSCAGGGYELALACSYILLVDDGASSVALPEAPLLAVLPGTGGLTRLTDKRKVRRDLADVFCTLEEGVRGRRAVAWRLVDEIASPRNFDAAIADSAARYAADSRRPDGGVVGIKMMPLQRDFDDGGVHYRFVDVEVERDKYRARVVLRGPDAMPPSSPAMLREEGEAYWLLRLAREFDDALLHLRFNESEAGLIILTTSGDADLVRSHEAFLLAHCDDWLVHEILMLWKRVLKRLDLTSRSLVAFVQPGSCFVGVMAELLFSVDRSYMFDGVEEGNNGTAAIIGLSEVNFGLFPMSNGLTRLGARFFGDADGLATIEGYIGASLSAAECIEAGLVTFAYDDIDWEDEIRLFLEERVSFSPDVLTAMEANLRFVGPETMETRIFGRLTAWQNWLFQRPNAVGEVGALRRYGTGLRSEFDRERI